MQRAFDDCSPRFRYYVAWNELIRPCSREFSSHTNSHKVGIQAIILDPILNFGLIRPFYCPRINLNVLPAMLVFAKALPESAGILSWIAKRQPNNLCVFIG